MKMRQQVKLAYQERLGQQPAVLTRAPGRLEILGNHTDYNEGTVLSVAVDRATFVAAGPQPGDCCRLLDIVTGEERQFSLSELSAPTPGDWANYIKGLIVELQRRGIMVPAFTAVFGSTVPIAAGMSSSAALEMSMLLALCRLASIELPWLELARIGQACENNYVGAKTGLLDQFSSLKGKAGHLVHSDFRQLAVENIPLPDGVAFVVANSMVKHDLTNEYNQRREACEAAVRVLQQKDAKVRALRDVSPAKLYAAQPSLEPIVFRRALHVVSEIERVDKGVAALQQNDLTQFGKLLFASHDSSRENFANSSPELDLLVRLASQMPAALGARLSGGGFGGITVHLVPTADAPLYAEQLANRHQQQTGWKIETMICAAADGAEIY